MAQPSIHARSDAKTVLPDGRLGRLLALGVTVLLLVLVWLAAVAPLLGWYHDRAEFNADRRAYATRMSEVVAQAPTLQRRAAALRANGPLPTSLLSGDTDAIAGARLQEIVQGLASRDGITLASSETLPGVQVGRYRRIGLRISLTAPYAVLVRLMQAILQDAPRGIAGQSGIGLAAGVAATAADAAPQMLIDDLDVQGSRLINKPADAPLDTRLTVLAFRAAASAQAVSKNATSAPTGPIMAGPTTAGTGTQSALGNQSAIGPAIQGE